MWAWKCENLGLSEEENKIKQWGFYLLLSHLEPIIIVLRSLEKTCIFLMIDQILLCTFHQLKILMISAETSMHLVVFTPNSIFTKDKNYQWGWMDCCQQRMQKPHIYILKFHACLWFLGFMHHFMLSLLLPYRKLPFSGSKLFGYCFFKSVCVFEVSSR